LLDVSRGLGIPVPQADKLVQRKVGEDISQGDVIAGPVGIFQRIVRAPQDGRVVALGNGQVLLELETTMLELRAGIAGVVVELVPDRGAIIETQGALLQGVWGNNLIEDGMLTVLARSPEDELTSNAWMSVKEALSSWAAPAHMRKYSALRLKCLCEL